MTRFHAEGRMFDDPDSDYASDGNFPPFVVFDQVDQINLPASFPHRHAADVVASLLNAAQPKPPEPEPEMKNYCVSFERTDFFSVLIRAKDREEARENALEQLLQDEAPEADGSDGFQFTNTEEITNG
jgi:hypothetical protein